MASTKRTVEFASPDEKAQWLDAMATVDSRVPYVRSFAVRFAKDPTISPNDYEGLARQIHRFVRDSIKYVPDPQWEELADTETMLRRGYEDCDGKARAFVALCRAVGIDARIRPIYAQGTDDFIHVQAEVRWPGSERLPEAGAGGWLGAELIVKGIPLGANPEHYRGAGGVFSLS